MDNDRPSLDLKHFDKICMDKNGMSKHNFMNQGLSEMRDFSKFP